MKNPTYPVDCDDCRRRFDVNTRQAQGCVYEERTDAPRTPYVLRWDRGGVIDLPFTPSACPLYLGRLPALAEVEAARPHWERGQLDSYLAAGDVPGVATPGFHDAIAALDRSGEEIQSLRLQRKRGGG